MKQGNQQRTERKLFSNLGVFTSTMSRLFRGAFRQKTTLVFSIVSLDLINAAARIFVVLLIALAVKLLSSSTGFSFWVIEFNPGTSLQTIIAFGAVIGIASLIGAFAGYNSVRLSRKLGRWSNELSMNTLFGILAQPPSLAVKAQYDAPGNLNVLLTQVPIHTGLATETLARLINPGLLLIFSAIVLIYQQPLFAAASFALALLFLPVFVRTSRHIRANAKEFYSERAIALGSGVGTLTNLMNAQHGVAEKQQFSADSKSGTLSGSGFAREFFDSYDTNLLGNERVILIVSLADALLRPVLFVVLALMVFVGEFTIEATIAFLGALAYMLASARSVSGLLINLLRYHPQVIHYHNFVDASKTENRQNNSANSTFPTKLEIRTTGSITKMGSKTISLKPGELSLVLHREKISTLNLAKTLPPLLGAHITNANVLNNVYFVSDSFRFGNVTIMEQLCAQNCNQKRRDIAVQHCLDMDADDNFNSLPQGYNTRMNEAVWSRLNAQARVAIRTVPLFMQKKPNAILIDIGVIRGIGNKMLPVLSKALPDSYIFLMQDYASRNSGYHADHYLRIGDDLEVMSGNEQWLQDQLETIANATQESTGIPNAEFLV